MKFFLQTQIGVENITKLELENKFKGKFSIDYIGFVPHKNGIIQLDWRSEENLDFYKELGTIEDAYFILDYLKDLEGDLTPREITKKFNIKDMKSRVDFFFDNLNSFDGSKDFRFVTRKKAPQDFRRIDLHQEMERFFEHKVPRANVTREEGSKEIWTTMVKNRLIVGIRLTDRTKRHSEYKTERVHGSLRPTVAYAISYISEIRSKDVIWDPFCGAGTIPCEIVEHFNFGKLFASDISSEAIEATKANLNSTKNYKRLKGKVSIKQEDFFGSKNFSDLIITNLPFGKQYEIDTDFLSKFTDKIHEVKNLRQITILFSKELEIEGWQLTRKFKLQVLGLECNLMVFRKNS